jgi:hypothetical protein
VSVMFTVSLILAAAEDVSAGAGFLDDKMFMLSDTIKWTL